MGKSQSKSTVAHNADPQIRIINTQEMHSEQLEHHETLIRVILAVVVIQLLITIYKMYKKQTKLQALKAAKSVADLANV